MSKWLKMAFHGKIRSLNMFDRLDSFLDFIDFVDYIDSIDSIDSYAYELDNERESESAHLRSTKRTVPRHDISDATNPLQSLTDEQFRSIFRFSKDTVVREIFPLLNFQNPPNERGLPVPPMLQLLTALKFYATCGFQEECCDIVGVSQATVSRVVKRVSQRLAEASSKFIDFPTETDKITFICNDFYDVAHFPDVVGCVGCTHIPVVSPGGASAELYRNTRGYMSINVQVVVGPTMVIQDLSCRWPGSCQNRKVFENSEVRARFKSADYRGSVLLGDNSYPQLPYLFVPVLGDSPTPAQRRYNDAHRTTYGVVESFFTAWKQRFPCLQQKLRCKFTTSVAIIEACAVLHNIGRACNDNVEGIHVQDYEAVPVKNSSQGDRIGIEIREEFIQKHFSV